MLYGVDGELFLDCLIGIFVNDNEECLCKTKERIKPLWIDDVLWTLLDMGGNIKAPVSLRAVGAFTVSGVSVYEKSTVMNTWSADELKRIVEEYISHFAESINNSSMNDFVDNLSQPYRCVIRNALYCIHNRQYEKALELIDENKPGIFKNGDTDINDAIKKFCMERMEVSTK